MAAPSSAYASEPANASRPHMSQIASAMPALPACSATTPGEAKMPLPIIVPITSEMPLSTVSVRGSSDCARGTAARSSSSSMGATRALSTTVAMHSAMCERKCATTNKQTKSS